MSFILYACVAARLQTVSCCVCGEPHAFQVLAREHLQTPPPAHSFGGTGYLQGDMQGTSWKSEVGALVTSAAPSVPLWVC